MNKKRKVNEKEVLVIIKKKMKFLMIVPVYTVHSSVCSLDFLVLLLKGNHMVSVNMFISI